MLALNQGVLRLSDIQTNQNIPKQDVLVKTAREVFQKALGHGRARAILHYTLPDINTWDVDGNALELILTTLQEELNFPFMDYYSGRLGNFEVFHLAPWLEANAPIITDFQESRSKTEANTKILEICRTVTFAQTSHTAHLICRTEGDVITDRLIYLEPETLRQAVELPEMPDELEIWLFEEKNGAPIFYEQSTYLRQIGLTMGISGHTVTIQDELSARAKQAGKNSHKQISNITSISSHRSIIGGDRNGSWRAFSNSMQNFTLQRSTSDCADKWFPKGIKGEIGAISHLNKLLNSGSIERAVIVDPWFGADSVARLLLRLSSQGMKIDVITSWLSTDPDTNNPILSNANPTKILEASLDKTRHLLNPFVTVTNLVDGRNQAFHDRYLLIYPHEGITKTFLLSNSINKMAGNWPFAMSLLAPSVTIEVQRYIEGLLKCNDVARGRRLTETFRWSSRDKP